MAAAPDKVSCKCADFVARPSLFPVAVPTNRWLMPVYTKDIMSRMDHIKARITSVFGSVLKMDSTKKIIIVTTAGLFIVLYV